MYANAVVVDSKIYSGLPRAREIRFEKKTTGYRRGDRNTQLLDLIARYKRKENCIDFTRTPIVSDVL